MAIALGRLKNKRSTIGDKRGFEGIHDRFQKDSIFRESQISIDRTEDVCIQMDKDAQKDFSYWMKEDEYFRYKKNWWISLNKSGKIGPVRNRSDFNQAYQSLEKSNSRRFLSGNTSNDTHRLLHPEWNDSWWRTWHLTRKSSMKERRPVLPFLHNFRRVDFQDFSFCCS